MWVRRGRAGADKSITTLNALSIVRFILHFGLGGHPTATVGATAAGLDAFLHIAQLLTALGASFADFDTNAAHGLGVLGPRNHDISGGLASFGTGQHEPEVRGLHMLAAVFKAMTGSHADSSGRDCRATF
jgi:hypothetical protein